MFSEVALFMDFKKIVVGTTCAIGVATVGLGVYFGVRQYKFKKFMEIGDALPVNFKYTAHTGCMGTNDNSLESIDAAVANGADIVEFDLNFTESGEPVLAHDAPKGGEVTLDEAFKKVSEYENIMVNVDIKSTVNLPIVRTLAEKYGIFDRIFFTGVNDKFLDAVRSDGNGVPYYLNVDVKSETKRSAKYIQSLVDKVKNSGAIGINFKTRDIYFSSMGITFVGAFVPSSSRPNSILKSMSSIYNKPCLNIYSTPGS